MDDPTEGPDSRRARPDWDAVARFLAGESPPAEASAVRGWLAGDPDRLARFQALDRALDRAAVAAPAGLDVEAALSRVHERIDEPEAIPLRPPSTTTPRRFDMGRLAKGLRAAAAIAVILTGGVVLWDRMDRGSQALTFSTGVGERTRTTLADGTSVILGPGSRLTVSAGYGDDAREVELQGEALFDVTHDDARPFSVRAGDARVLDLGTKFTVRTAQGEGVRVVVTSGSVVLGRDGAPRDEGVVLRKGDRGAWTAGRAVAQRASATDEDLAWTQGRLVFRDAPLPRVAADLRRWYGIELRAGDAALAERRLTASFGTETRAEVVRVVALALGAEVETRGDTAVLRLPRSADP